MAWLRAWERSWQEAGTVVRSTGRGRSLNGAAYTLARIAHPDQAGDVRRRRPLAYPTRRRPEPWPPAGTPAAATAADAPSA